MRPLKVVNVKVKTIQWKESRTRGAAEHRLTFSWMAALSEGGCPNQSSRHAERRLSRNEQLWSVWHPFISCRIHLFKDYVLLVIIPHGLFQSSSIEYENIWEKLLEVENILVKSLYKELEFCWQISVEKSCWGGMYYFFSGAIIFLFLRFKTWKAYGQ